MLLSHACSFSLALIEKMSPAGLTVGVMDDRDGRPVRMTVTAEDIGGNYENEVFLKPRVPNDQMQKMSMGIRLSEARKISDETLWNQFVDVPIPTDEADRIALEDAMRAPELRPNVILKNLVDQVGYQEALTFLINTPFMPPPKPGMVWFQAKPGGKVVEVSQEQLQMVSSMGPSGGPPPGPGGPMMPMGPGGPPQLMPPGPPPMGPPMPPPMGGPMGPPPGPPMLQGPPPGQPMGPPPPQIPPELMAMIEAGQVPPPVVDALLNGSISADELMAAMAQAGLLPPGMGMGPMQPGAITGPMGAGPTPVMQGQLEPEMLGLGPEPNPLMFAAATGQRLPRNEELAAIGGL
jgi:hypothetical protein